MLEYKSGYQYQLVENYAIYVGLEMVFEVQTTFLKLDQSGNLMIKAGYSWDGPSGPGFDTDNFMTASLVHDALYQLIRMGYLPQELRQRCDEILKDICLSVGMSRFRAWYIYKGIRIGGASSASPDNKKVVEKAPIPKALNFRIRL